MGGKNVYTSRTIALCEYISTFQFLRSQLGFIFHSTLISNLTPKNIIHHFYFSRRDYLDIVVFVNSSSRTGYRFVQLSFWQYWFRSANVFILLLRRLCVMCPLWRLSKHSKTRPLCVTLSHLCWKCAKYSNQRHTINSFKHFELEMRNIFQALQYTTTTPFFFLI